MERVQFQQEQMLAELKELMEKNVFTKKETKQIMKTRTAFETTLVRRVAQKADFLRYATYEMGLEQLRRKRMERMKLPRTSHTVSDYALVRRQFQIFERALKRFKSDVSLWVQYIQLAKREGARALVGRITARALQFHPDKPALYIIAASHELDHHSPSAARSLLQRGIRLNKESVDMWREYLRMELGFIESLRRRWNVLGIEVKDNGPDTSDKIVGHGAQLDDEMVVGNEEGSQEENSSRLEGDSGMEARMGIMNGAIVKSVITSAAEALPAIELFEALKQAIESHPSPIELRIYLLGHLYDTLEASKIGQEVAAIRLLTKRYLTPDLRGEDVVDRIKTANEFILGKINKDIAVEEVLAIYGDFVEEWIGLSIDQTLKKYLILSLRRVIGLYSGSGSLLSTHIKLMMRQPELEGVGSAKVLLRCRNYSTKAPKSAEVWLGRLAVERHLEADAKTVERAWRQARISVEGTREEVEKVWLWGVVGDRAERQRTLESLLPESIVIGQWLHERLLISYVGTVREGVEGTGGEQWGKWVGGLREQYLMTSTTWRAVFEAGILLSECGTVRDAAQVVYLHWRLHDQPEAEAQWRQFVENN